MVLFETMLDTVLGNSLFKYTYPTLINTKKVNLAATFSMHLCERFIYLHLWYAVNIFTGQVLSTSNIDNLTNSFMVNVTS